jgi:RNA polymerase-interacting CarD/CdnL/TRCF family regulator
MVENEISFQVGDQVIHWSYGPGKILQLDEKELSGTIRQYYVVQIRDLTLWVPVDEPSRRCLRLPTPAREFKHLYKVLAGAPESLSGDRFERKVQLTERLKDGALESVCQVVRDLTYHKRSKKMNDHDNDVLNRARNFLLSEWSVSLSIPVEQAEEELKRLLGEDSPNGRA